MLVTQAVGGGIVGGGHPGLDRLDPVEAEISPDASMVSCYAMLRPAAEAAATAVIALDPMRRTR